MTISNVTAQQSALAGWVSNNPTQATAQIEAQIQARTQAQAQSEAQSASATNPPVQQGGSNPNALAQFASELQSFLTNVQSGQPATGSTTTSASAASTNASDPDATSAAAADADPTDADSAAAASANPLQQLAAMLQQILGQTGGQSSSGTTAATQATGSTASATTATTASATGTASDSTTASGSSSDSTSADSGSSNQDSLQNVLDRLQQTLSTALQAYQFTNPIALAAGQVV